MRHVVDESCAFEVQNGKIWCITHNQRMTREGSDAEENKDLWDWTPHKGHNIVRLPFKHILFTASFCKDCRVPLFDEEQ